MSSIEDTPQLMPKWLQKEEDFCIIGQDIETSEPWKSWLTGVHLKYGQIVMDFIAIGYDFEWFSKYDPTPNPFIVFLFPHKPEVEEIRLSVWESFKDVHKESLMLMGGPLDLREFMDQIPGNRSIKVLITTPWLFEKFIAVDKISTSWTRLLILYQVTNATSPPLLTDLTKQLLHPGTRTTIMISETFGPKDRAVAQAFLKPDYHVVHLPYQSLEGLSNDQLLQNASNWIASRPLGQKILVLCGTNYFCNELAKNQSSDGQQILSSRTNFGYLFSGVGYRSFNQGECSVIAIPVEEIKNIDIKKADVIYNLGMSSNTCILSLYGSVRGIAIPLPPP